MRIRQFIDYTCNGYAYIVDDESTRDAFIIDPTANDLDKYLQFIKELNLNLKYSFETHVHADHITGAGDLRKALGCECLVGEYAKCTNYDGVFHHGDNFLIGNINLQVIYTPGHTSDSYCFYVKEYGCLFSGDTLLIRGCGRTDFQNGEATELYKSVTEQLFLLPSDTIIYPGHDYNGRTQSTIHEEKLFNSRLANKTLEEYCQIMDNLNLPKPKLIDIAVPANRKCGIME
ncbi:MAG: MBL fold metallo-hydrolase [Neisseriaceae bacterium]|jgi:sulfur dioxygenase